MFQALFLGVRQQTKIHNCHEAYKLVQRDKQETKHRRVRNVYAHAHVSFAVGKRSNGNEKLTSYSERQVNSVLC